MATESVTTSVTVGFDIESVDGPSSILSAEIDGRETEDGGYNGGDTNFKPGDTVGIMLFKTSNVTLTTSLSSAGTLSSYGTNAFAASSEVDSFLVFNAEPSVSLSYPCTTGTTGFNWLGNSLGAFTITNFGAQVELVTEPTTEYYVAVLHAVYVSYGTGITLTNTLLTGEDKYEIFCFWAGTLPAA